MCGAIVSLLTALIVAALIVGSAVFSIGATLVVLYLICLGRLAQAQSRTPSSMICPNCHSRNVRIKSRIDGLSSTRAAGGSIVFSDNTIKRSHVATCQDCGFDYPYYTQSDVDELEVRARRNLIIVAVLVVLFFALVVPFFRQ